MLRAFIPRNSAKPIGLSLLQTAWVKFNRGRISVGQFHSSMDKWGLAFLPKCECDAPKHTADHVLTACSIHQAPHGAGGLMFLDDETRCWLKNIIASL